MGAQRGAGAVRETVFGSVVDGPVTGRSDPAEGGQVLIEPGMDPGVHHRIAG